MSKESTKKEATVDAREAIQAIKSGDRVIIPLGSGEPQTVIEAMVADKERFKNVEIVGGLMRNYKFLQSGLEESFHFRTWQCAPPIAKMIGTTVNYMPIRQGDVPNIFAQDGPYPIDVAIVHVSPPDRHGFCSMGVSISHSLPTALSSKTVIAEVNEQMPRVLGNCFLHTSQIDFMVHSSRPLVEFPSGETVSELEETIAGYVAELIPDGATLQIGIGAIPMAVVASISRKKGIKIFGMGVDSIVDLTEKGVISRNIGGAAMCPVVAGEFLGTKKLFDFIDNNPMVEGRGTIDALNAKIIGSIRDFISIQSAIEVDIYGQVNVETLRRKQFSAVGGSHDFLQGAYQAEGGKSIIAMPSTTADGKTSRISAGFATGTAVAHPRHSVDYIITEYGTAYLRGKTLEERAEAMMSIAHPDFREELREAISKSKN